MIIIMKMIDPLLTDMAPATNNLNARLRRQVELMTAQWEDLNKETTPSPAPPPPQTAPPPPQMVPSPPAIVPSPPATAQ